MSLITSIGEVMIELSTNQGDDCRLSYAGDTYNTAVYLARHGIATGYLTRLGTESHSDIILEKLAAEGIDNSLIERDSQRQPGLYMIRNYAGGEREFSYWRNDSAARHLFAEQEPTPALLNSRILYFSAISIAIICAAARDKLYNFLCDYRAKGGKVAFDSNFRPKLWPNLETARVQTLRFLSITDIALLTLEDEQALWGEEREEQALTRLQGLKIPELVIKRGAEPALVSEAGTPFIEAPVVKVINVVDTTAAGDSFNAGYLAARLKDLSTIEGVRSGALCAGTVIQHKGAIVSPSDYQRTYAALAEV